MWHTIEFSFKDYIISPNEKFAITFSGFTEEEEDQELEIKEIKKKEEAKIVKKDEKVDVKKEEVKKDDPKKVDNIFIWDIMKQEIVRSFYINKSESFQNFKFSHDSKYLARIKKDHVMIYVSPEMTMLPVIN